MNPVAKATKRCGLHARLTEATTTQSEKESLAESANPAPTTMHSPTLANDFPSLDSRPLTVSAASFALRSLPPQQIPCSHTLADSSSLFALFSALASFVFSNLRTLFAKHRGCGYLCDISAPSAPLRYHLPFLPPLYFYPLTNPSSSRIDLQHSLFSCTDKSLFPQLLCIHIYTKRPGCRPPHNFSTDGLDPLLRKFSFSSIACYRARQQGGFAKCQ